MAGINDFVVLKCSCGTDLFTPLVRLKYKAEGGTISEPAGHYCVACHAVVDTRYLQQLLDRQRKQAEIQRLQAEVNEAPAPTRSVAPVLVPPPR